MADTNIANCGIGRDKGSGTASRQSNVTNSGETYKSGTGLATCAPGRNMGSRAAKRRSDHINSNDTAGSGTDITDYGTGRIQGSNAASRRGCSVKAHEGHNPNGKPPQRGGASRGAVHQPRKLGSSPRA